MRSMLDELRRAILNKGFLLAIVLVFLMYFIDGNQALDEYADVLSLLDQITDIGAFTWIIPCVGTLCHAGSFVSEFTSGNVRYRYIRGSIRRYALQKCAAVFVSACLAICIGIGLYGGYAYLVCGRIMNPETLGNYLPYAEHSFHILVAEGHYVGYILVHTLLRGIAAGMWSLTGLCLSTVWKNNYIALFSPVVVIYFKDFVWSWLSIHPRVTLKSMEMGSIYVGGVARPAGIIVGTFALVSLALTACVYLSLKRGCCNV